MAYRMCGGWFDLVISQKGFSYFLLLFVYFAVLTYSFFYILNLLQIRYLYVLVKLLAWCSSSFCYYFFFVLFSILLICIKRESSFHMTTSNNTTKTSSISIVYYMYFVLVVFYMDVFLTQLFSIYLYWTRWFRCVYVNRGLAVQSS